MAMESSHQRARLSVAALSPGGTSQLPITESQQAAADRAADWISELYDCIDYGEVLRRAAEDEEKLHGQLEDEAEELIYGEFSIALFCALLDKLAPSPKTTFIDVGSGRGQLVLTAASGWKWAECIGVELVPELHHMACAAYGIAASMSPHGGQLGPMSPCRFLQLDMYTSLAQATNTAPAVDGGVPFIVFMYATKFQCLPPPDDDSLKVSASLRMALPVGAIVVTVNNKLLEKDGFQLLEEFLGPNPEGGDVCVFIWEAV